MTEQPPEESCFASGQSILSDGLSAAGLDLSVTGFTALWHGRALQPQELIPGDSASAVAVVAALVARGRAEVDSDGKLIGVHGLTLRSTRHRIIHDGAVHHTWCAFDSIGISAALDIDASAHTDCGACQRPLHIPIRAGRPETDEDLRLWLPAATGQHLMSEFCARADLFCSSEHLERRIDTTTAVGRMTDLETAVALGRTTWADIALTALDATSRPPS